MCRRIALLGLALLALGGCEHATPLPGDQPVRVPDRTVGTSPLEPAMVRERCTTTWVGPRRGEWHLARHWSARREPTALDEACVPRGRTVLISHGTAHVGALVAGGDLVMTGGTLELASLETASEVFNLRIGGRAALYGAGNLIVIGSERVGGRMVRGHGVPSPPLTPCGRHSPRGLPDCRAAPTLDELAIARTWRRLVHLVHSGAPRDAIAPLVTPGCRHEIARLRDAERWRLSPRLGDVMVSGARATAPITGVDHFERRHGRWRVALLASCSLPG